MIEFPKIKVRFRAEEIGLFAYLQDATDFIQNRINETLGHYRHIGNLVRIDDPCKHEVVYQWYV